MSLTDATVQDDRTNDEKKADEILGIANIAYLARDKQRALESLNSSIETFEKSKLDYEMRIKYETRIKVLEAERDTLEKYLTMTIKQPRTFIKSFEMTRDKYEIQGQVGAVGPEAHAHDINFNQLWNQTSSEIDLEKLAEELFNLKTVLKNEAEKPEHYRAIAEVAEAETVAKEGNGAKALEHLKKAGKWAFDVAEKVGNSVATTALKSALGL